MWSDKSATSTLQDIDIIIQVLVSIYNEQIWPILEASKFDQLEAYIDPLEAHIDPLEASIDSFEAYIDPLEDSIDPLEASIDHQKRL